MLCFVKLVKLSVLNKEYLYDYDLTEINENLL